MTQQRDHTARSRARAAFATAAALAVAALAAAPAWGQCGAICIYEVGTPQMGSSYAGFAATAQDAGTAFLNPAGMTRLDEAEILMGSYAAFFELKFDSNQAGTQPPPPGFTNDGGNAGEFLPGAGSYAVLPITEDLRFGMTMNGIFGGSAIYNSNWIGRTFVTDVKLTILNLEPALGLRLTDWLSVGAGLNVFYARLNKFRLRAGPALDAATLRADGADDWEPTFSLGLLLEPREGTRIGASYRYEADMTLKGGDAQNFSYDFELPQGFNVSLFQQLTPKLALLADAGWSDWSGFSQQEIMVSGVDLNFSRRWRDTWRAATGFQYQIAERWLLQGGFSYDSSPVRNSRRTPDLPASEQYRFSTGIQYDIRDSMTAGISYTFLWFGNPKIDKVPIPPFPPPPETGVVLDGEYKDSWGQFIGLTFIWRFCSPFPWASCPSRPEPLG